MSEWNEDLVRHVGWDMPAELPPGAPKERRRLATAIRTLAARCSRAEAPESELRAAAEQVEAAIAQLAPYPDRTQREALRGSDLDSSRFAERLPLIGLSNPFSPPMFLEPEGEISVARVTFGGVHEGAPGWVHGGMISAALDQAFGYAQLRRGQSSVTKSLTVRYLKPTPVDRELRIEIRLVSTSGRESYLTGKLLVGDAVTVEADATFFAIDPESFRSRLRDGEGP